MGKGTDLEKMRYLSRLKRGDLELLKIIAIYNDFDIPETVTEQESQLEEFKAKITFMKSYLKENPKVKDSFIRNGGGNRIGKFKTNLLMTLACHTSDGAAKGAIE